MGIAALGQQGFGPLGVVAIRRLIPNMAYTGMVAMAEVMTCMPWAVARRWASEATMPGWASSGATPRETTACDEAD